jgi:urea transport system ATP-binding protein
VFESHTVEDNLELALKKPRSVFGAVLAHGRRDERASRRSSNHPPGDARTARRPLSHGQKQWLEIGMLLAQDPKLLLVDEPVAGMTDARPRRPRSCSRRSQQEDAFGRRGRARHDFVRELGVRSPACTKARCWPKARSTR